MFIVIAQATDDFWIIGPGYKVEQREGVLTSDSHEYEARREEKSWNIYVKEMMDADRLGQGISIGWYHEAGDCDQVFRDLYTAMIEGKGSFQMPMPAPGKKSNE